MKYRLLVTSMLLGLALFTTGVAITDTDKQRGHGAHGERWSHAERIGRHLDLTDTQREQIRAAVQTHRPELRELRRQMREHRRAIRELAHDGFNEESVREHADALGAIAGQSAFVRARLQADIHAVLTEEQRQSLRERAEKRRDHRKGRQSDRRGRRS